MTDKLIPPSVNKIRSLSATWKMDTKTDIDFSVHEEALSNILANEIQKSIDEEMIFSMSMIAKGWTPVTIGTMPALLTVEWLDVNIKHGYKHRSGTWYFEDSDDAAWFILRWA